MPRLSRSSNEDPHNHEILLDGCYTLRLRYSNRMALGLAAQAETEKRTP